VPCVQVARSGATERCPRARWAGVPFVMKAGKALNERKVEIRVQFKPPAADLHGNSLNKMRNELVVRSASGANASDSTDAGQRPAVPCRASRLLLSGGQVECAGSMSSPFSGRLWPPPMCCGVGPAPVCCAARQMCIQPDEAIYMKMVLKKPGLEMDAIVSEMDLSYKQRYSESYIPDAYERLLLDALRGDQQHFVRRCGPGAARDGRMAGRHRCALRDVRWPGTQPAGARLRQPGHRLFARPALLSWRQM